VVVDVQSSNNVSTNAGIFTAHVKVLDAITIVNCGPAPYAMWPQALLRGLFITEIRTASLLRAELDAPGLPIFTHAA